MKKSILFIVGTFLFPLIAMANPDRQSCVVQILKNDTSTSSANFILVCDSETLLQYRLKAFDKMSPQEVKKTKEQFFQILKGLIGNGDSVTCREFDSELFWIGLCHR